MKIVRSFQHDPLRRQCAEAVWINKIKPSKLINNKKEFHQPGDVQVRYEKNENEDIKKRKQAIREAKKRKIDEKYEKPVEKTKQPREVQMTISQFVRNMRVENETNKEYNKSVHESTTQCCNQCEYKTKSKESLKEHKNSVHEKGTYPCDKCELRFESKEHLQEHNNSSHEKGTYPCDKCDFRFENNVNLQTHIESVHKGDVIEEWQPSTQEIIEDSRIRRQLQKSNKEIKLKCNQCEWTSTSKSLLNRHIVISHTIILGPGSPLAIAATDNSSDKTDVEENLENIAMTTSEKEPLKAHKQKKRPYESKRIKCEHCDKKFNKKERHSIHMKSVHNEILEVTLKQKQAFNSGSDLPGQDGGAQTQILNKDNLSTKDMTSLENRRVLRNNKNRDNF